MSDPDHIPLNYPSEIVQCLRCRTVGTEEHVCDSWQGTEDPFEPAITDWICTHCLDAESPRGKSR